MANVGWNSSQNHEANVQDLANSLSNGGRSGSLAPGISRSQDDANVDYIFQRHNESDLSGFGNKKWAGGGDDTMLSQMQRDFNAFGLDVEYSKKLWGQHEDRTQDKGGTSNMFTSGRSPWAPPPSSNWAAPSDSHRDGGGTRRPSTFPEVSGLLQPHLPSMQFGGAEDMVEFLIRDGSSESGKASDRLQRKFAPNRNDGDDKGISMTAETSSPFEGDKEPEKDVGLMSNGLDDESYRGLGAVHDSPPRGEEEKADTSGRGSGRGVLSGALKQDDYLDQPVQNAGPGMLQIEHYENVMQPYEYPSSIGPAPSMDSPGIAFSQHSDYNHPPMGNMIRISHQHPQHHPGMDGGHQLGPTQGSMMAPHQGHTPGSMMAPHQGPPHQGTMPPPQQPQIMQQPPPQQQQQLQQQQQISITPANGPAAFAPAQYVLNGQDPYTLGIPIAAPTVQYVPWGLYPTNILQPAGPQQAMQQQQIMQQGPPRGAQGRPLTPSQMQQEGSMGPGGQNAQQPIDFAAPAGYQIIPAYYDQNGQLVVNNGRGVNGPQIRLVSPAPILLNPQQGFAAGFNGPVQNMSQQQQPPQQQMGPQQQMMAQQQQPPPQQQMSYSHSNAGQHEFGLNLRRDSYDPNEKFRSTGSQGFHPFGMPPSPAGPLGLVQPAQPLSPPAALNGPSSSLPIGMGSGGRPYNAAPGAESKYRNNSYMNNNSGYPAQKNMHKGGSKEGTGRSRLLEDFRGNLLPALQLKDLTGHVVEFSKDQHGSRFIQQKLERATPHEKAMVFNEVLTAAFGLMTDVFGNYVIQKFFEFGSMEQKEALASRIQGNVLSLALQMYGCRVIQKALESIPKEMQVEIVKELNNHVLKCIRDQNGNHVVQKCIECVDPGHLQFIIDAFNSPSPSQVFSLSTHPYGCRVIQRILEHCTPAQTAPILEQLHQRVDQLVQDQYGNYVIQHVLEHGRAEDRAKIIATVKGKVLQLAQHKFASNVVEKCVATSGRADKALLIEEVCSGGESQSALYIMMKDQYANYVVQKMIDVAEAAQRKLLMHKIRPHTATLRKFTYGKHILNKMDKYFAKSSGEGGSSLVTGATAGMM